MQQIKIRFSFFATLLLILLTLPQCRQERQAAPIPPEVRAYVYAYTSGVISRVSPIKVQFSQAVASPEEVGRSVSDEFLSFTPSIDGEAAWEDERTLRFDPAAPLPSAASFIATVQLGKIIADVPAAAGSFEFGFQTRGQFLELTIDGLYATDANNLSEQELRGELYTADYAASEAVERVLQANQNRESLDISWSHSADQQEHAFTIRGIERTENPGTVELRWQGKALGIDQSGERSVEVPALGDFRVTEAEVIQNQTPYVSAHFSDPLQESQNLAGLVDIQGYNGQIRFLIDGQELRVYPVQRLNGQVRIVFRPGIRNSQGDRMQQSSEWTLRITDVKPQVRLVGSGVILPQSEGLIFPFEAIGLRAVDIEVLKIFNTNILQFLQSNQLDGSSQLREVGRIIRKEKIELAQLNPNAPSGEWTRYALDLKKLLREDPEAIYQVRIGFRPEYASYFCNGKPLADAGADNLQRTEMVLVEGEEPESIMNQWYGVDGYYDGYRWEHREDPCFPAYYNSDRFVARNILSSNLGIIAKGGDDNRFFVAVTDLRNTQPAGSTTIEFYDYQQQLIQSVNTNSDGTAMADLPRKPFVAVARKAEQSGYLRLQDGDALSLSRFDVSGAITQQGLKGFLYADRGVWRPGDSVYLQFVLDDRYDKLPSNYPIAFELQDPRGALRERYATSNNTGSIYPLHFATSPDDPTGNWIARVKAGGAAFDRIIKIETVKPNRLSIDLDFGSEALYASREPVQGQLEVKWLHGAPARGIRAKVEVNLQSVRPSFENFTGYTFQDPSREIDYEPKTIFEAQLDAQGKASLQGEIFQQPNAPGPLQAGFRTRAFEPSGDFSTGYKAMPYHPYDAYAGLRLPENEYGEPTVEVNQNAFIELAAVDPQGNPLRNRQLSIGVYRVDWRWWWEQGYDNIARFNSSNHVNALQSPSRLSTDNQGKARWKTSFDEWGRYLVRVCDTESGHCSGNFVYAGAPSYGDDPDSREAAATLNFRADKDKYAVGETATLTIPTGQEGRALVTLENGTKVIRSFWSEATEGENTFTFEVTEEMHPTVYAHVSLLQPHAQVQNDLPIRMYGVIPVSVEDPGTVLHPEIAMPDELEPEQEFTVEVAEREGRPMAYTVAVVDEGLLSLTNFQTPNPHEAIYAREALGVRTWDVYDQVLGAFGQQLERVLSIGGDAALRPDAAQQRANRFEPVVRHLGPFYLEAGQRRKHQIQMPNYVGAVRTMVVASHQGAYGAVDKSVPVKQPLMVLATLPRVLSPGERLQLPVTVFAMDKKVRNVSVRVEENANLANWAGPTSKQVSFSKPGEEMVNFEFQVTDRTGVARFTVIASGNGVNARQTIEIQVRNPNPVQTRVMAEVLQPGADWTPAFQPLGMPGTNEGMLEVSSLPPLNLGERLQYLLTYPYGCVEQTLSAGFPQLYVHRLLDLDERRREEAAENVRATVSRLQQFQTSQGGFAYWPGQGSADQWSTSYGGHFLVEAQNMGYTLPPGLLESWMDFQEKAARMWTPRLGEYGFSDPRSNQLNQAYRLYTLALAQEPDMAAMNRLREIDGLSNIARWRLAAAYALAGQGEAARELIDQASTQVEAYNELSGTFGTHIRDRAMILETLVLLEEEEQAAQLLQYLSDELSADQWLGTQTTAYALLAISKYVGEDEVQQQFQFTYQVNEGQSVNAGSGNPVMQVEVPVRAGREGKLLVKNGSQGKLFARLILRGQPVTGAETDAANDLQVAVSYKDREGNPINTGSLLQGSDFVAEVRVTHPGSRPIRYQELALSQVFPSGWEILNTRLDAMEDEGPQPVNYEYQDIRDDRVNTFFDLAPGETHTFRVLLNAAYEGRFYLPATSCEAMYDNSIYAREAGQWVEVRRQADI